jgi:hypothetical protein
MHCNPKTPKPIPVTDASWGVIVIGLCFNVKIKKIPGRLPVFINVKSLN